MHKALFYLRLIGRCFWLAWTGKIFEEDED